MVGQAVEVLDDQETGVRKAVGDYPSRFAGALAEMVTQPLGGLTNGVGTGLASGRANVLGEGAQKGAQGGDRQYLCCDFDNASVASREAVRLEGAAADDYAAVGDAAALDRSLAAGGRLQCRNRLASAIARPPTRPCSCSWARHCAKS